MVMVSIVIPVYQVSDYIERCINSIMAQTYSDIECIIVNDATLDDSIEKAVNLVGYDNSKFKFLHHKENRGLSAARNTGIEVARGEWIFFMDSDDELTPDCIELLFEKAQRSPEIEVIIGNYSTHYFEKPVDAYIKPDTPNGLLTEDMFVPLFRQHRLPMAAWNKLINRSFLTRHHLRFKEGVVYEDLLWTFYLMKYMTNVYVCPEVTYHYYRRPNSIMTSTDDLTVGKSFYMIYDEILNNLTPGKEGIELDRYVEGFCLRFLKHKDSFSSYVLLMNRYKNLAKEYGLNRVLSKLDLTCLIDNLPFGVRALQRLQASRNRIRMCVSLMGWR